MESDIEILVKHMLHEGNKRVDWPTKKSVDSADNFNIIETSLKEIVSLLYQDVVGFWTLVLCINVFF